MKQKTTKFFSAPLMKQNIKSNYILVIAITLIMCLICCVSTYSTSIMKDTENQKQYTEVQEEFFSYLYIIASYNEAVGTNLSYSDFLSASDTSEYEQVFEMGNQQSDELNLNVNDFKSVINTLNKSAVDLDTYEHEFEYVYALGQVKGCFTNDDLDIEDMMNTIMETMGIDPAMLDTMQNIDSTKLFNQMDYTILGLLPIFIYIVIVANSIVVDQVDRGSMAYVLSTPIKRSAVTITQAIFLLVSPLIITVITCITRLIASKIFLDDVNTKQIILLYAGIYLVAEAVAGICYLGSCIFDQKKKSMAFGGGLTVWFFISSLLGMFGTKDLVDIGFGTNALNVFNKLTIIGLFDTNAISTIGSGDVNYDFIWKFGILGAVALVCYIIGSLRFQKKDLPL